MFTERTSLESMRVGYESQTEFNIEWQTWTDGNGKHFAVKLDLKKKEQGKYFNIYNFVRQYYQDFLGQTFRDLCLVDWRWSRIC